MVLENRDGKAASRSDTYQRVIFQILEEDLQERAKLRLGRPLTQDELYSVRKGVQSGLCFWEQVVDCAIDEAVSR